MEFELWESVRVRFYEFRHRYLLDGETRLIGVTELMKKHGLSPDYGGVDEAVLAHAAELGTQAHKRIEDYCDGKAVPDCKLIKTFKKLSINVVRCEYLVTDETTVASSIDLLAEVSPGVFDIIDMKRTSTVHRDALAWQLGIYRYLFLLKNPEAKVNKCYCLPIKKGRKDDIEDDSCGALVEIKPVTTEMVEALIDAERKGETFANKSEKNEMNAGSGIIPYTDWQAVVEFSRKIDEAKRALDALQSSYSIVADRIYCKMLSAGVEKLEAGDTVITLRPPHSRIIVDTKKLAAEEPEIYDKYTRRSDVKGYITIKTK